MEQDRHHEDREARRALLAYLVAGVRLGDARAGGQLVRAAGPRLLAHAARLLGDAEGARDVVQEAWSEILRGLSGLRDDRAFLPWAMRIVARRVAREIRRRQRQRQVDGAAVAAEDLVVPEAGPDRVDAARVRQALAALSPAHRSTLALFYLEDMSVAEVALATDVPAGTVKTRLMHARAALRAQLEGDGNEQS